jgi:nucleoside-diphosphate-sugar epimerase
VKAIITGASGFVGRALARRLPEATRIALGAAGWREAIGAATFKSATVFHLAGRAHGSGDAERLFVEDNVEKTAALAQAAAAGGAERLVFLSSIKVNGEESPGRPLAANDPEAPADAYARSKQAAERALREVAARSSLAIVIVRSPLVIGEGARGNLHALMRLSDSAWPLPFAGIDNRRTFVHVDDLATLLIAAASSSQARDRVFLAGHPDAVSTPRLVRVLRKAMGRAPRLIPMPVRTLEILGAAVGSGARVQRLTRSLEVDSGETHRALGWTPAVPMDEGIAAMARAFRRARGAA